MILFFPSDETTTDAVINQRYFLFINGTGKIIATRLSLITFYMSFDDLHLIPPILKALQDEGYETPTPIQEKAIPLILQRRDLLGCAQTGTGKTAAFAIPILQELYKEQAARSHADAHPKPMAEGAGRSQGAPKRIIAPIRALILTPTRELAIQIDESFGAYGKYAGLRHTVIFGGVSQLSQTDALRGGIDILTATPGRLLDLIQQRYVNLKDVGIFVLDEADRMLDMGFIHDVRKIIQLLPAKRQTLFFSATMAPEILVLANAILMNPARVEVTPVATTAETVTQSVYMVDKKDKSALLIYLLKNKEIRTALVFARTKHGADKVAKGLNFANIKTEAIHGNKSQNARQRALNAFKTGQLRVLVATDIAARGIDVEDLSLVINYELPNIPETYVHRIGRTGRAGASGVAYSFCEAEERPFLRDIQRLIGQTIPVVDAHPYPMSQEPPAFVPSAPMMQQRRRPAGRRRY